ncbi:hypothetical protein BB561_004080 [Smittium simulii]|uniref:separase n=1 Tax=Smittium simulii TaxID=133385 RepID=A0A2T9YI40_9FUNG|nr:hypothetical protein BB561_004080 [Smittium simulii]
MNAKSLDLGDITPATCTKLQVDKFFAHLSIQISKDSYSTFYKHSSNVSEFGNESLYYTCASLLKPGLSSLPIKLLAQTNKLSFAQIEPENLNGLINYTNIVQAALLFLERFKCKIRLENLALEKAAINFLSLIVESNQIMKLELKSIFLTLMIMLEKNQSSKPTISKNDNSDFVNRLVFPTFCAQTLKNSTDYLKICISYILNLHKYLLSKNYTTDINIFFTDPDSLLYIRQIASYINSLLKSDPISSNKLMLRFSKNILSIATLVNSNMKYEIAILGISCLSSLNIKKDDLFNLIHIMQNFLSTLYSSMQKNNSVDELDVYYQIYQKYIGFCVSTLKKKVDSGAKLPLLPTSKLISKTISIEKKLKTDFIYTHELLKVQNGNHSTSDLKQSITTSSLISNIYQAAIYIHSEKSIPQEQIQKVELEAVLLSIETLKSVLFNFGLQHKYLQNIKGQIVKKNTNKTIYILSTGCIGFIEQIIDQSNTQYTTLLEGLYEAHSMILGANQDYLVNWPDLLIESLSKATKILTEMPHDLLSYKHERLKSISTIHYKTAASLYKSKQFDLSLKFALKSIEYIQDYNDSSLEVSRQSELIATIYMNLKQYEKSVSWIGTSIKLLFSHYYSSWALQQVLIFVDDNVIINGITENQENEPILKKLDSIMRLFVDLLRKDSRITKKSSLNSYQSATKLIGVSVESANTRCQVSLVKHKIILAQFEDAVIIFNQIKKNLTLTTTGINTSYQLIRLDLQYLLINFCEKIDFTYLQNIFNSYDKIKSKISLYQAHQILGEIYTVADYFAANQDPILESVILEFGYHISFYFNIKFDGNILLLFSLIKTANFQKAAAIYQQIAKNNLEDKHNYTSFGLETSSEEELMLKLVNIVISSNIGKSFNFQVDLQDMLTLLAKIGANFLSSNPSFYLQSILLLSKFFFQHNQINKSTLLALQSYKILSNLVVYFSQKSSRLFKGRESLDVDENIFTSASGAEKADIWETLAVSSNFRLQQVAFDIIQNIIEIYFVRGRQQELEHFTDKLSELTTIFNIPRLILSSNLTKSNFWIKQGNIKKCYEYLTLTGIIFDPVDFSTNEDSVKKFVLSLCQTEHQIASNFGFILRLADNFNNSKEFKTSLVVYQTLINHLGPKNEFISYFNDLQEYIEFKIDYYTAKISESESFYSAYKIEKLLSNNHLHNTFFGKNSISELQDNQHFLRYNPSIANDLLVMYLDIFYSFLCQNIESQVIKVANSPIIVPKYMPKDEILSPQKSKGRASKELLTLTNILTLVESSLKNIIIGVLNDNFIPINPLILGNIGILRAALLIILLNRSILVYHNSYAREIAECLELGSNYDIWFRKSESTINSILKSNILRYQNHFAEITEKDLDIFESCWSKKSLTADNGYIDQILFNGLSSNISVCSLVHDSKLQVLYVIRYNKKSNITNSTQPLIIQIPIESLNHDIKKLEKIICSTDSSINFTGSGNLVSYDDKVEWWAQRTNLENEFKIFLEYIQNSWFRCFISAITPQFFFENIDDLEIIEELTESILGSLLKSNKHKNQISENLINIDVIHIMILAFKMNSSESAIEEIALFVLSNYCSNSSGSIGYTKSEVVNLKKSILPFLEKYSEIIRICGNEHLVLILGSKLVDIPWESFLALKHIPICRMPSLHSLVDLSSKNEATSLESDKKMDSNDFEFAESFAENVDEAVLLSPTDKYRKNQKNSSGLVIENEFSLMSISKKNKYKNLSDYLDLSIEKRESNFYREHTTDSYNTVDGAKVYYLLNPSGDLKRTEDVFKAHLLDNENKGWSGVIGRAPIANEISHGLGGNEVFLYFGHGGGDKYIRRTDLLNAKELKVSILFGCSSAKLTNDGDFSAYGPILDYIATGRGVSIIGNLFDVGDKDIDRFSIEFYEVWWGIKESSKKKKHCECSQCSNLGITGLSNVQAIHLSRNKCKMRHLTGSAPVVYGIPVYNRLNV